MMAASVAILGLGFASTNSMQQVRLVAGAGLRRAEYIRAPCRAGDRLGDRGLLFGRQLLHSMGFVAAAFVVLAVALVLQTRPTATGPMVAA